MSNSRNIIYKYFKRLNEEVGETPAMHRADELDLITGVRDSCNRFLEHFKRFEGTLSGIYDEATENMIMGKVQELKALMDTVARGERPPIK